MSLVCGNASPTPYAEWPDPAAQTVTQKLVPGAPGRGGLTFGTTAAANETLTDNATITATTSMNAATLGTRLVYQTNVLREPVRISGTPWLNPRVAFSKPKANLTGMLISYPGTGGNGTLLSRGWLDPENPGVDVPQRSDHARRVLRPDVRPAGEGHGHPGRPAAGVHDPLERLRAHAAAGAGHS